MCGVKCLETIIFILKKIIPRPVFRFFQPIYHFKLSFLAALFYRFPSRRLKIIGVTGTNGKTTVVALLHHIFAESGFRVASISSLRFKILNEEKKNELKMTMPGRFFIQKFLRDCVNKKIEYVIIEVTSEGIKQFRHKFIKFDVAVLTNIAPEHIESHGSFEKYLEAKLSFFRSLSPGAVAVINGDDPSAEKFSQAAGTARKIFYGKKEISWRGKDFWVRDLMLKPDGISFLLDGALFESPLLGEFNFYNILAASAAAISQDLRFDRIRKSVADFNGAPGRLEFVQQEPFSVVVDYAHTPDALRKVYETLRRANSKMICVLGAAGGGRDKWKRPEMGKIAAELCDKVILTNEDPYDESPQSIIEDIESGLSQFKSLKFKDVDYKKIIDRREAIREALKSAKAGDTVIITGKGAEPWIMGPNNSKIPWDDRETAREELKKMI